MNDLTKEELKHIHEILVDACFQWKEPNITYELRDKIQSMIDNYSECKIMVRNEPRNIEEFIENCSHDWDEFEPNYCVKCKRVF
jgi:hypothetical protein